MRSRVTLVHVLEGNKFTAICYAHFKRDSLRQVNEKLWTVTLFRPLQSQRQGI